MDGSKLAISCEAFQREYRGMSGRDFWGLLARFLGLSPPSTFKGFGSKPFFVKGLQKALRLALNGFQRPLKGLFEAF
jgi:hypothetical protein